MQVTDQTARQVLIGQLTDTHVLAPDDDTTEVFVDNNARLADAVASINAEEPGLDLVVATGDLTNDARADEYDELCDLLGGVTVDLLPLPGNHDERTELRGRFPDVPWAGAEHASWVATVGHVRVIGLDSTRPGHHGGEFDDDRAAWLSSVLAEAHDGVTLLAMHHPPFRSGIDWMDANGFLGLDLLAEVVHGQPIARIMCGHLHRPMGSSFAGIPAQVGMSTVQHVALDLRGVGAIAVIDDPVGYQIHQVVDDAVVTHSRYIGTGLPIVPKWAATFR